MEKEAEARKSGVVGETEKSHGAGHSLWRPMSRKKEDWVRS